MEKVGRLKGSPGSVKYTTPEILDMVDSPAIYQTTPDLSMVLATHAPGISQSEKTSTTDLKRPGGQPVTLRLSPSG